MDVERDAGGGTGSARRRRQRRLRSHLRHERMSVAMALAEFTHHSAQCQKTARAGREARVVLHGHVPVAPLPQRSRPPSLGEPRGAQDQDQLRTTEQAAAYAPMYRFWYSSATVGGSAGGRHALLRHASACSRAGYRSAQDPASLCAPLCATRSWWNGWWKCRRSYPFLPCSGLWSSTSTFQFLVVEGETLAFKVFLPDRVQQRRVFLWNAFLSGLRSRSLIFMFLVEAFKIIAQDWVHPLLRMFQLAIKKAWMSLVKGFF